MPKVDKNGGDSGGKNRKKASQLAPREKKPEDPVPVKERKVLYPELEEERCVGEDAITVEQMKALLGWTEETEQVKFGDRYLVVDRNGKKIRCENNLTNRPLYMSVVDALVQEHLNRRWRYNGEPIIVGRYGSILNGQHCGVSLIFAEQERLIDAQRPSPLWKKNWPEPVTMEKLVAFGIDEVDDVVNTMDTCKPRSLADVIYRCAYFAGSSPNERKKLARMLDHAVRLLWHRLGITHDAFAPRRTHAEALDFVARHEKHFLRFVRHVFEEDADGHISDRVSPGYAAGMGFLMAASASEPKPYRAGDPPNENLLDWSNLDKAEDFWTTLASKDSSELGPVRVLLKELDAADNITGGRDNKLAVLCRAWQVFVGGRMPSRAVDFDDLWTAPDATGFRRLIEVPTVGGIDLGDPDASGGEEPEGSDPTLEEIENGKEEVYLDREKREPRAEKPKAKAAAPDHTEPQTLEEQLDALKEANENRLLVFRLTKGYKVYGNDAKDVAVVLKTSMLRESGTTTVRIADDKIVEAVAKLRSTGRRVSICEQVGRETVVTPAEDWKPGGRDLLPTAEPKKGSKRPK